MSIKQITSFYDFEKWLEGKQQHVEELEHENTELTIENRRLRQEIDRLRKSQVEYINRQLNRKKPSAETDDQIRIMRDNEIIPHIFRKQEQL